MWYFNEPPYVYEKEPMKGVSYTINAKDAYILLKEDLLTLMEVGEIKVDLTGSKWEARVNKIAGCNETLVEYDKGSFYLTINIK